MRKRLLIVVSLTIVFVLAVQPLQSVSSALITELEVAQMKTFQNGQEKGGNALVRVLKAPFKALGRLFGRGRKNDNKLHRLSEKDVEKFESSQITRVVDAKSAPVSSPHQVHSNLPAETVGDAREDREGLAQQHLERGRQLLRSGNLNDAVSAFSLAISFDPKLKEAFNLLGVVYGTKGMRNLALESFQRSLEGDHDNPEHLNNLGYFYYHIGEYENATRYLKKAVKRAPNEERYWNNLGLAQVQRGKFDDAYKSFTRAMGEFEGRLNVASRLQRLGQDKEAIKHLVKARGLRPASRETLTRLILLYERNGKYDEAMETRISLVKLEATAKGTAE